MFFQAYIQPSIATVKNPLQTEPCFYQKLEAKIRETRERALTFSDVVSQPAHVKACFLGSSLSIPITDGKLALGTWQGIWLCEHRNHAGSRKLVVTLTGVLRDSARSPLSPVSPIASTSS